MVYRRRELWLLLLFAVSLGAGLAVREFRAGFPDLSDRLEQLDREEPTLPVTPPAAFSSRSPKRSEIQATREGRGAEGRAGDGTRGAAGRVGDGARGAAGRVGDEAGQLDLNRATTEELQRLPGIGPTLAEQIVRARERRGRFASPEDLRTVPGIGQKKFEGIRDLITVREGRGAEGRVGDGAREAEGGAGDHLPPAIPAPPRPQPPEDTEIREFQGQ